MRNTLALTGMLLVLIGFSQLTIVAQTDPQKPDPQTQEPLPPVIGKMKAREAAARLDQFGEKEEAAEIRKALKAQNAADTELASIAASGSNRGNVLRRLLVSSVSLNQPQATFWRLLTRGTWLRIKT